MLGRSAARHPSKEAKLAFGDSSFAKSMRVYLDKIFILFIHPNFIDSDTAINN